MAVLGTGGAVSKSSSSSSKSKKSVGTSGTVNTEDLTKYSNDYKAEIDRRSAIDPNDSSIRTLTKLRKQKLSDIEGGYLAADGTPAWLSGAPSMSTQMGGSAANDYYDKALEEQQRAIREQTESAVSANNAYIPKFNAQADQGLQNAYILREQNLVNAPQALAGLGYSGGASETELNRIRTGYENSRNTIEQGRTQALTDIAQNEAQIRATGDASLANSAASYNERLAQLIAQQEAAAQDQANWQQQFDFQNQQYDFSQQQYADSLAQQAWQNAYDERLLSLKQAEENKKKENKKVVDTTPSGNANTVLTNAKRALGGSNGGSQVAWDAAVNYIQNSLKSGMITSYEAQQMINQLGLS